MTLLHIVLDPLIEEGGPHVSLCSTGRTGSIVSGCYTDMDTGARRVNAHQGTSGITLKLKPQDLFNFLWNKLLCNMSIEQRIIPFFHIHIYFVNY